MTLTADALVVGAGIAGISTAWHLRRAGLSVLLIDAVGPASAASGRNPGFLWLQSKKAGPTMDLALRLRRFAEDFARDRGDTSFRACGGLVLWRETEAEPAARAYAADRRAAGLPIELLTDPRCASWFPRWDPRFRAESGTRSTRIRRRLTSRGTSLRTSAGWAAPSARPRAWRT
jgi:sarcosine oxidase, subunit beta